MPIPKYSRIEGRKIVGGGCVTVNGQAHVYYFTLCYGKKMYTFDMGTTWSTNKRQAFLEAGNTL